MDIEGEIRRMVEGGELDAAATRAIDAYGPEVLGFLGSLLKTTSDADDAFAQTCEDVWAGLGKFAWRSSLRTWIYVLARNAAMRLLRSPHRRADRRIALSNVSEAAARVRTQTAPHLRTEVKDKFAQIREALDPDDRALLVLRVDRQMEWNDIARVMFPDDVVAKAAARLRKRFQLVKEDVRERAKKAGLLDDE